MAKIPKSIDSVVITDDIFIKTIDQLKKIGEEHKEGIAYWSGILDSNKAMIQNVIFANEYPEFYNEQYFANVSLGTSFKIGEKIHERDEILFAQVHTHPAEAFHSFVDNNHPISHRVGFLSVVIPYFGKGVTSLSQCKVYEYEGKANWNEMKKDEIEKKFEVK